MAFKHSYYFGIDKRYKAATSSLSDDIHAAGAGFSIVW